MTLLKATVTQLIMRQPPRGPLPWPDDGCRYDLVRVEAIPLDYYRYLYDAVGRPHHWTSRHMPDDRLSREIHADPVRIHVLYGNGAPAGWFELDVHPEVRETRIVHFAILPDFRGRRLAAPLLSQAVQAGFESNPTVLSLETNNLDHPAALPLYIKGGFEPVGTREVLTPALKD
ncbi:GNAT family N-acetyltransferase [Consotaella aegiceratis]|uniref:GNAT family N-acetyltransferase n=1 Tax=Consotaella aegiceratis TaxID=3097961 RepID=UPI002F41851E